MRPSDESQLKPLLERLDAIQEQLRLQRIPIATLMTLEEAAKVLNRSPRTVERYIQAGHLTGVHLPAAEGGMRGAWMVQSSDLQAFIDRHKSARPVTPPLAASTTSMKKKSEPIRISDRL